MSFVSYFITDPNFSISQTLKIIQTHKPDFVCYRNKEYFDENEIIEFANFAKKYSKIFINYDSLKNPDLIKLFVGIHLPSSKLDKISEFKNKIVIASTHSIDEIKSAKEADFITFSPVFNSKGRKGVGIEKLNEICKFHPKVIALGGIVSDKEVEEVKKSRAVGFASIRYFYFNTGSILT
ncbi:thiamine phosphate synthase [Caminibacter sp.]